MSVLNQERSYRNPAHRSAFRKGLQAAKNGTPRESPYNASEQVSAYFHRAWLAGYDSVPALKADDDV